jgi:hypothetical protein
MWLEGARECHTLHGIGFGPQKLSVLRIKATVFVTTRLFTAAVAVAVAVSIRGAAK